MTEPRFRLTAGQFDVLWQDLGLGRPPYPLDVPSVGDTVEERQQLRAQVRAELGGHPDQRLTDLLRLLAHHDIAVDSLAHIGRPVRAIAASDHHHAVLAVLDHGEIGLTKIRPTALAKSIVDLLPENAGGPGNAHTLLVDTLHRAVALYEDPHEHGHDPWGHDDLDERAALVKAGVPSNDARALAELAAGRVAGGQFGMSYSEGRPVRTRAPVLITWFDTLQGRYLMVRDDQWLSVASTDNDRIRARIATVLSTIEKEHQVAVR